MSVWPAAGAAASRSGRTFLIDDGAALEDTELYADATCDDAPNGYTAVRIVRQHGIVHALEHLKAPWLHGCITRNGLVNVSWHCQTVVPWSEL